MSENDNGLVRREVSSNLDQRLEKGRTQRTLAIERRLMARLAFAKSSNVALQGANQEKDERIESMGRSIDALAEDELIKGLLSSKGFEELLRHDSELQDELREGDWGVLGIDLRGVKAANEAGTEVGDELLDIMAERALTRSLREGDLIRRKGDDFSILVRNVDEDRLKYVRDRVSARLSVSTALDDMTKGDIPIIASVSMVHATEEPLPRDFDSFEGLLRFEKDLEQVASLRNVKFKHDQYKEMLKQLDDPSVNPEDERMIATAFYRRFFPDFIKQLKKSRKLRRDVAYRGNS